MAAARPTLRFSTHRRLRARYPWCDHYPRAEHLQLLAAAVATAATAGGDTPAAALSPPTPSAQAGDAASGGGGSSGLLLTAASTTLDAMQRLQDTLKADCGTADAWFSAELGQCTKELRSLIGLRRQQCLHCPALVNSLLSEAKHLETRLARLQSFRDTVAAAVNHILALSGKSLALQPVLAEFSMFGPSNTDVEAGLQSVDRLVAKLSTYADVEEEDQATTRGRVLVALSAQQHTTALHALERAEDPAAAIAEWGSVAMLCGAHAADHEFVRALLSMGVNATQIDPCGRTALEYAVVAGADQVAQMLLNAGSTTTSGNAGIASLLHLAVAQPRFEVVRVLTEHFTTQGTDVFLRELLQPDCEQANALQVACAHCNDTAVEILCNAIPSDSADVFAAIVPRCLKTAAVAASSACLDVLTRTAQRFGLSIAPHASQALEAAALYGDSTCIQKLLNAGADPAYVDDAGDTPLHMAILAKNAAVLQDLLVVAPEWVRGVQPREAWVPLLHLALKTESEDCVRTLLAAGCSASDETADGWSAAAWTAYLGFLTKRPAIYAMIQAALETEGAAARHKGDARYASPDQVDALNRLWHRMPTLPLEPPVDLDLTFQISRPGSRTPAEFGLDIESKEPDAPWRAPLAAGQWEVMLTLGGWAKGQTIKQLPALQLQLAPGSDLASADSLVWLTVSQVSVPTAAADTSDSYQVLLHLERSSDQDPLFTAVHTTHRTQLAGSCAELESPMYFTGLSPSTFGVRLQLRSLCGRTLAHCVVPPEMLYNADPTNIFGQASVPLCTTGGDHLGIATLRFVFCHGLPADMPPPLKSWGNWSKSKLIGHRGYGADNATFGFNSDGTAVRRAHIAENTPLSFTAAGALGAEFVEFDVHLSGDNVPILFHDYTLNVQGGLVPLEQMTAAQFTSMRMPQDPKSLPKYTPTDRRLACLGADRPHPSFDLSPSGRIMTPFVTFQQALVQVPMHIGFNVEIKFPSHEEQFDEKLRIPNMHRLVDEVLRLVFTFGGSRRFVFTTFDPDICYMVTRKQAAFPVLYLTEAGTNCMADHRRNSVFAAVRTASVLGLWGVVHDCRPLVRYPRGFMEFRRAGLAFVTYNRLNNVPAVALLQRQLGASAVIVDHVAHVSKAWYALGDALEATA